VEVGQRSAAAADRLLAAYDEGVSAVYAYLRRRLGSQDLAEELTAETFLAAAATVSRNPPAEPGDISVGWLVGIARHKLVDHWRRAVREERTLTVLGREPDPLEDPWEATLDRVRAERVLAELPAQHRAVLTLRYLDDLTVREVARLLGRTEHATEALLVRARQRFRSAYDVSVEEGGRP
jgi:RNA polymerase sigma-70 factor (ECF subfamily)